MPTSYPPRAKISVTLSAEVVRQLETLSDTPEAPSRSRLVEEALRRWLEERAQRELGRQTEEYYRSLSPGEQEEDREWSAIAAQGAGRLWSG